MSFEKEQAKSREMESGFEIEVIYLGRPLEGRGKISSEVTDEEIPKIIEALKDSVELIDDPNYSACGDGRGVKKLASGRPGHNRTRKFGGGISPFNMRGLADPDFTEGLERAESSEDLYDACDHTSEMIGNKPSGHVGCGAGGGLITHNRSVASMGANSPNGQAATALTLETANHQVDEKEIRQNMAAISPQAAKWADLLDAKGWNGADYIERLARQDGDAVEILDAKDDELHGHAEKIVVAVISEADEDGRPLAGPGKNKFAQLTDGMQFFGFHLTELARDAAKQGRDASNALRHLVAGTMHHIAVYENLGDGSHPVVLLKIKLTPVLD